MAGIIRFIALGGTSNSRQFTPHGQKMGRDFHSINHHCCIVGQDHRIREARDYINTIVPLEVASYPGLDLKNMYTKKCPDEPFYDKFLFQFIDWATQQDNFSGILALFLLCNDKVFFQEPADFCPGVAVRDYLDLLQTYLEKVTALDKIKLIVLSTVIFRQSDFVDPSDYFCRKTSFNRAFLEVQNTDGYKIKLKGSVVPYVVIDMNTILPEKRMQETKFYCHKEVEKANGRLHCIHIKAKYMEKYLVALRKIYDQYMVQDPIEEKIEDKVVSNEEPLKRPCRRRRKPVRQHVASIFGNMDLT